MPQVRKTASVADVGLNLGTDERTAMTAAGSTADRLWRPDGADSVCYAGPRISTQAVITMSTAMYTDIAVIMLRLSATKRRSIRARSLAR